MQQDKVRMYENQPDKTKKGHCPASQHSAIRILLKLIQLKGIRNNIKNEKAKSEKYVKKSQHFLIGLRSPLS